MALEDYPLQNPVAEDAPNRCQCVTSKGQCLQGAVVGSKFCPVHGGNNVLDNQKQVSLNRYRLAKFMASAERFTSDSQIKDLRSELGILRMLIEEKINLCHTNVDLVIQAGPLGELILKTEKLVASIHRMDLECGRLLDKNQLLILADQILAVINEEVKDEDTKLRITDRMESLLKGQSNGNTAA